jgi:short subunit dehydrogenase-like uncharacterized protein
VARDRSRDGGADRAFGCGFDSIPSDLGVLVTADTVAADGAGELTETVLSVVSMRGGVSGGTIDSMRQQAIIARTEPGAQSILDDPYALSPDRAAEPPAPKPTPLPADLVGKATAMWTKARKSLPVQRDPQTGRWTAPFVMAGYNTRIVRRSNALLGWRYGRAFSYREVVDFGDSPKAPLMATGMTAGLLGVTAGMSYATTRQLLDRVLPKPGEGPSAERRAEGRFRMVITSHTTTGSHYVTTVGADYDPGYDGTAVMLGESALALAFDGDLPEMAGVLTPATALGMPLVERLRDHGFTFDCDRGLDASGVDALE